MARVRRLGRRFMDGREWQQRAFAGYIRSGSQALCSAFAIVGFADGSVSAIYNSPMSRCLTALVCRCVNSERYTLED